MGVRLPDGHGRRDEPGPTDERGTSVLILGVAAGLVGGLLAGGDILNLARIRLRGIAVIFAALLGRVVMEAALGAGVGLAEALRLPLYAILFGLLLAGLWANRRLPGMILAFTGIALNTLVVVMNGGHMTIWAPALAAAGYGPGDLSSPFHLLIPAAPDGEFITRLRFLGDVIPIPLPLVRNVISLGDIFLSLGLSLFLFGTVLGRVPMDQAIRPTVWRRRRTAGTGLAPGLAEASALERPLVLGGGLPGAATPGSGSAAPGPVALPPVIPTIPALQPWLTRLRHHPYVRLSLNGSFSALWAGQLISLFGDRVHQVALLFLVLRMTDSPAAVAAVLVVTTLPNLFLGPIAGAFVDRWDAREVMIVSDLLRAALVIAIPIAAATNLLLVFPLIFAVTAISIFFRPARVAALTRIVDEDDLLPANSALWVGETIADIGGYPLAGLFVAFLGDSLPLAFWIDGATYAASALLIFSIVLQPLPRAISAMRKTGSPGAAEGGVTAWTPAGESSAPGEDRPAGPHSAPQGIAPQVAVPQARGEMRPGPVGRLAGLERRWPVLAEAHEGWTFLRGESVLLANTMQALVGQVMIGIVLTLLPIYARDAIVGVSFSPEAIYSFLEAGIGVGNLVGGLAVGLIGARLRLGRMVIAGYALTGGLVAAMALTDHLAVAMAMIFGVGVGNLIFVIPSQTLFQQRTPAELMGRVVGLRFSLTFGAMTLGIAMAGLLGEALGAATVIGLFGLLTFWSGVAGLLVPAIRDA